MKALIIYYSKTGNTKKVGEDLAKKLGADTEELMDKKKRNGIFNWFLSGRDGMKKASTQIEEIKNDPSQYDLIILGSPIWGWNMTPAIRTYLKKNKQKIKNYAFFITSGNTPSEKIAPYFSEVMGSQPKAQVGFSTKELKDAKTYEQKIAQFLQDLEK